MPAHAVSGHVVRYLFLVGSGLMFAFPLFWTVSSSLQTWQELRSFEPHLLPSVPQWTNYSDVFNAVPYARWLGNSFLIVAITIPGTILTATFTAYAFARFDFHGRDLWFILMLSTMMIPRVVTFIPQYLLFFKIGLINTYIPLTIGAWLGGGAFMIFLRAPVHHEHPAGSGRGRAHGRGLPFPHPVQHHHAVDETGFDDRGHPDVSG